MTGGLCAETVAFKQKGSKDKKELMNIEKVVRLINSWHKLTTSALINVSSGFLSIYLLSQVRSIKK